MLFPQKAVAAKVYFTVEEVLIEQKYGLAVYVDKRERINKADENTPQLRMPFPDITISFSPETETERAAVKIYWNDETVTMKANRFSYETGRIGEVYWGCNQDGMKVVAYENEYEALIHVCLSGMRHLFEGERFTVTCSSKKTTFQSGKQTIMEASPLFEPGLWGKRQRKGWIYETYLAYLPYLSGIPLYGWLT